MDNNIKLTKGASIRGSNCMYEIVGSRDSNQFVACVKMSGELGSINSHVKVLVRRFDVNVLSEQQQAEAFMKSEKFIEKIGGKDSLFLVMKYDENQLESLGVDEMDNGDDEQTIIEKEVDDGFVHFENGKYTGNMRDGKPHGKGKMLWDDNSIYDGEWLDGYMQGNGSMIWPSGKQYTGEWKHSAINGYGTMNYPNGVVYQGMFVNGVRHGQGVLTKPNGERFEGEFNNNLITDNGKYYNENNNNAISKWDKIKSTLGTILFCLIACLFLLFLFSIAK